MAIRQTFTASTPGFFDGISLIQDSFPGGLNFSVSADTLTVNVLRGDFSAVATFQLQATVVPTPIPAALPLFAFAFGLGGLLGYRRKRKGAMAEA